MLACLVLAAWIAMPGASAAGQTTPSPTGLEANVVSGTRVDLSWSPPDDLGGLTVSGYNVYRDGVRVASTGDTVYSDTDLSPATSYRYYVTTTSTLGGESEPSNEVTATTPDVSPPTIPQDVRTTAVESTRVSLAWSASRDEQSGVTGYRVYRDGTLVAEPSTTGHTDTGLSPGTTYDFRVSSVNGEGLESGRSATLTATTDTTDASGSPGGDGGGESEDTVPPAPPTDLRVAS